jgi:hypothetical protein
MVGFLIQQVGQRAPLMKVVFLDIDGVLNSSRTANAFKRYGFPESTGGYFLDPIAMQMVENICKATGAVVVISSTWRIGRTLEQLQKVFDAYKTDVKVLGKTVTNMGPRKNRGHEIEYYLDCHPEITHFVILDDDSDMLETQLNHFIHVDPDVGLSALNAEEAERILS